MVLIGWDLGVTYAFVSSSEMLVAVVEFVVDVICDYVVHDGMIAVAIVMSSAVVEIDCDQILHLERSEEKNSSSSIFYL
jgi:xanthine/uracil/vitamin C permease (AzgA family)